MVNASSNKMPEFDPASSPQSGTKLPQSTSQYRLWFANSRFPGALDYHVIGMYKISGDIDVPALTYALQEVEARHPALRCIFSDDEDGIQYVLDPGHITLERISSRNPQAAAVSWLSRPFSLETAPPFRVAIVNGSDNHRFLCFAVHHIVCDQHSWKVINREISLFYRQYRSGHPPVQLGEDGYIQAIRRESATGLGVAHSDATNLEPIADLRLPGVRSTHDEGPGLASVVLPTDLVIRMSAYAASLRVTLSAVMLSACGLFVAKLTGEDLVTFTVPVSTREPEDEDTVGCFINLAILQLNVAHYLSAKEIVAAAWDQTMKALTERMTPFQDVIAALRSSGAIRGRDLPRMVSFNVLMIEESDELELDDLTVTEEHNIYLALRNDLSFTVTQSGNQVSLTVRYDPRRVEGVAVEALTASVPVLCELLINNRHVAGRQLLNGSTPTPIPVSKDSESDAHEA